MLRVGTTALRFSNSDINVTKATAVGHGAVFVYFAARRGRSPMMNEPTHEHRAEGAANQSGRRRSTAPLPKSAPGRRSPAGFFRVGGAAGTVAKTISAYDMAVSDAIYGPADRYVSRQRLQAMLDYEFDLLLQRLDKTRGDKSTFFVFANTVATHSFSHQNGRPRLAGHQVSNRSRAGRRRKSSSTCGCSTRKTSASRRRSASSA